MKTLLTCILFALATVQVIAQNGNDSPEPLGPASLDPIGEIVIPILFICFLVFMLINLVKYFFDFRLKNKLIDRGMAEQLSVYVSNKNHQEKQTEAIRLSILCCGIGIGLTLIYFTAPIHIHSLAIMAFSLGLSYLAYFFYLRK